MIRTKKGKYVDQKSLAEAIEMEQALTIRWLEDALEKAKEGDYRGARVLMEFGIREINTLVAYESIEEVKDE